MSNRFLPIINDGPYGNERPYKNLDRVLEAFAAVLPHYPGVLVLAGIPLPPTPRLCRRIHELRIEDRIHWTGFLPAARMPAVYRGARILVAPSLIEGFGLQVLEMMAAGRPVITSTDGASAEIAGDVALLVSPTRTEDIVDAMRKILDDPELAADVPNFTDIKPQFQISEVLK